MTKIDADAVQKEYNSLVTILGCDSAADSLQCLRQAPYETLKSFMLASSGIFQYTSLDLVSVFWAAALYVVCLLSYLSPANVGLGASNRRDRSDRSADEACSGGESRQRTIRHWQVETTTSMHPRY